MNAQDAVLNQGIAEFRNGHYREAAELFRQAVAANPNSVNPHLYLATAYMSMWIPGLQSTPNVALAESAETEFKRVLELDSNNKTALASLASLAYNSAGPLQPEEKNRKLDEAADWYKRLAAVDPVNKEAPYSLGVIAWAKWYPALMTARAEQGMKPEDPGPLANPAREELKAKFSSIIDEGIENLDLALKIDPNYFDAMAYMNLLIREHADLSDTKEEYAAGIASADGWLHWALDTKKNMQTQSDLGSRVPVRGGGILQPQTVTPASTVEPVYPPLARQARIEGTVRFVVRIAKDGSIQNIQLISGHPLLVAAATDAVQKYRYDPVILNGSAIEAVTQVDVKFALGN